MPVNNPSDKQLALEDFDQHMPQDMDPHQRNILTLLLFELEAGKDSLGAGPHPQQGAGCKCDCKPRSNAAEASVPMRT